MSTQQRSNCPASKWQVLIFDDEARFKIIPQLPFDEPDDTVIEGGGNGEVLNAFFNNLYSAFSKNECVVTIVDKPSEAIEHLKAHTVHLFIVDIMMMFMDSSQFGDMGNIFTYNATGGGLSTGLVLIHEILKMKDCADFLSPELEIWILTNVSSSDLDLTDLPIPKARVIRKDQIRGREERFVERLLESLERAE
jgi:hypothetical protein